MKPLRGEDAIAELERLPLAIVYKHSPLCGLSDIAAREVRRFADANPGAPVFIVDVIRDRALSLELARRLEIRHESPQVIVVRNGRPVWDASHRRVTADALAEVAA